MLNDCKFGNNNDLTEHLSGALKILQDNQFEAQLTEDDNRYCSIIHQGRIKEIDQLIDAL